MKQATCAKHGCTNLVAVPDDSPLNLLHCCSEECRRLTNFASPIGVEAVCSPIRSPVAGLRPVMLTEYDNNPGSPTCGKYVETQQARFHGWGVDYEEFEAGPGNFTTAIVELDDGTVMNLPARLVRFLDRGEG